MKQILTSIGLVLLGSALSIAALIAFSEARFRSWKEGFHSASAICTKVWVEER